MNEPIKRLSLFVFALIAFPFSSLAAKNLPTTGFISAPSRADIAYDTQHDVLYISGGSSLLRYDLSTRTFLPAIDIGGTTKGMDISPDGGTLAVANTGHELAQNYV